MQADHRSQRIHVEKPTSSHDNPLLAARYVDKAIKIRIIYSGQLNIHSLCTVCHDARCVEFNMKRDAYEQSSRCE